jgi:Undecaprenyl-phosphate glucose phosphotransferase
MLVNDLFFLSVSWWLAFWLRFFSGLIPQPESYVFQAYVIAWLLVLATWSAVFLLLDLYRPRRISSHWREAADIVRGSGLAVLVFLGIVFLLHDIVLSRLVVIFFWLLSVAFLNLSHVACREGLRYLRRRGYNLRHVLVIGTPVEAGRLIQKLEWHRHLGLRIAAVHLTEESGPAPATDAKLIRGSAEILPIIRSGAVDQVFVALPLDQMAKLNEIPGWVGDEPVTVHVVPDLGEFGTLSGAVEKFDGLHVITLQDSSMYGWNSFLKRTMDITLGTLALFVFSPLLVLIAGAIKILTGGPVFYRQERMGLDGTRFEMLKFRTMIEGAEDASGPVWAADDDPRVTPVGQWLRKTSLDELPQLLNVLRGDMSLVGPRPERPPLIAEFRRAIPRYMLRHKVKAGMTGWAQINGWRGNTSLERRIEHDLDYIEHWSPWRDMKILALTLLFGFRQRKTSETRVRAMR